MFIRHFILSNLRLRPFHITRNISKMSSNLIGLCQMRSTNDKLNNRQQIQELVKSGLSSNAKFFFFPEGCDFIGNSAEETLQLSESLEGDTVNFYKKICRDNKIWASFGGIHEKIDNEKIHNTHLIINEDGEIVGCYRKLHLFDVDTPEFKFRESKVVEGGKSISRPVETIIGKIGMQICYDIRFPEGGIWLKSNGAHILTYPSAFAMTTGKAHWEILNKCRAIENQCFVISPAQEGPHNEKRCSYGNAMVVSPWGEILARCTEELEIQVVNIDLKAIEKVERNMPCFSHRRPDVYSIDFNVDVEFNDTAEPYIFEKFPIDRRTIFFETQHVIAFTNIRCVVPGHCLVATKRIIARMEEMTKDEIKELFSTATLISSKLEKFHNAKSSTVTVQDGPFAGQTVKHVHCHVMPRKPGDFEENDEIYVRLNEHDKEGVKEKRRSIEEMIEEAMIYRKLMKE